MLRLAPLLLAAVGVDFGRCLHIGGVSNVRVESAVLPVPVEDYLARHEVVECAATSLYERIDFAEDRRRL